MSDSGVHRYELLRNSLQERFHQHTRDLTTGTEAGRELHEVTQALRRLAEGTYGTCERCRIRIPLGRLRLMPHARFCVPCDRHQPRRSPAGRLPHARGVPSMPGLTVVRRPGPGSVVRLTLAGEIDLANADGLRADIIDALSEPRATGLVIDLAQVDFLSGAGASALVTGRRAAVAGARSYAVVNAHGIARKVLLVTGLLDRLAHHVPYRVAPPAAGRSATGRELHDEQEARR